MRKLHREARLEPFAGRVRPERHRAGCALPMKVLDLTEFGLLSISFP